MTRFALRLVTLILGLAGVAMAASAQDSARIAFAAGSDTAAISGSVTGEGYVDYLLGARAGQTMAVSLIPGESGGIGNVYFNILPPGSTGEAIYIGSIDGLDATGVLLPADGDYTIRVYQLGNDADTGVTSAFTLSVTIM